jgi:hypothetical protein
MVVEGNLYFTTLTVLLTLLWLYEEFYSKNRGALRCRVPCSYA